MLFEAGKQVAVMAERARAGETVMSLYGRLVFLISVCCEFDLHDRQIASQISVPNHKSLGKKI